MQPPFAPRAFVLAFTALLISFALAGAQQPRLKQLRVAVLDLETRSTLTLSEAASLSDVLQSKLQEVSTLILVDRGKTKKTLAAQGFKRTETCSDIDCAVEAGKLLNVDKVIAGTIGKFGKTFTVYVQITDVASGQIQWQKTDRHEGEVDGLGDVVSRLAVEAATVLEGKPTGQVAQQASPTVTAREEDTHRFALDVTYYGSDYTENTYSRAYLSPLSITASFAMFDALALQASVCLLQGNYKLKVPTDSRINNLLQNRDRLWGDHLYSTGFGVGLCLRLGGLRFGGQYIQFADVETDLSPNSGVLLSADLYLIRPLYIGLGALAANGTGLIAPDRVGPGVHSYDRGVTRRGFGSPTVLTLRLGFDLF